MIMVMVMVMVTYNQYRSKWEDDHQCCNTLSPPGVGNLGMGNYCKPDTLGKRSLHCMSF